MSESEIPKTYEPQSVESAWYQRWLDHDCFKATVDPAKEPFAIMIPPPNVTGVLHMGHLLNNTIQDILTRRARQDGKAALWLPGTDHAGIATQSRVEKELRKNGQTRHDLGREKFVETAAEWRDKHGGIILEQLKKLGASCDWSRKVHTLDPAYSKAVLQAFVTLYDRGHIYRGKRMVNWCPASLTGLSDEEVIMKPQKGTFYRMRYEIVELPGEFVEIGTTRPETIPGDSAVAVHPDDPRYQHLIGKHVWRPFPRAKIPVVADPHVEKDFGSGVLKVTPAHDKVDFEIGQRHQLEIIDVMNPDGTMNDLAGEKLAGLERFKARTVAAQMLKDLGLLLKEEPYENNVGFSERADVPIEPRLSEQWFIKYPKVEEAKRAVSEGFVQFHPERWSKVYLHWLNNIQDWCISRQLWWGHRIPVWYKKNADRNDPANRHVALDEPADPENWEQDNDVLDTWASSWLWCLATLGWQKPGETTPDLKFWYPTSALATGPDIIFLWVARMIIAGMEFYGEEKTTLTDDEIRARIPFKNVYFNGIIRDAQGRKMSKSLGNSPEPLDLIAKFGADGLRFGLLSIAPKGQDLLFSEDRISLGRNFCNKLWNAARFRQMQDSRGDAETRSEDNENQDTDHSATAGSLSSKSATAEKSLRASAPPREHKSPEALTSRISSAVADADDHAILANLAATTDTINTALASFDFNTYTSELYRFFWTDFCDWYVEVAKARLQDPASKETVLAIQDLCLRQFLLLLHPVAPFITEELFHRLGFCGENDFIQNTSPGTGDQLRAALQAHGLTLDTSAVAHIATLREFVTQARALKAQQNQAAKKDSKFLLQAKDAPAAAFVQTNLEKIKKLIGAEELTIAQDAGQNHHAAHVAGENGTAHVTAKNDPATGNDTSRVAASPHESSGTVAQTGPATPTELGTLSLDLTGLIDIAAEKTRLTKELEKLEKLAAAGQAKLSNETFVSKAPPHILDGARAQLADTLAKRDEIKRLLTSLG